MDGKEIKQEYAPEEVDSDYNKLIREKLEKDGYETDHRGSMVMSIKKSTEESMDFEETESVMWRKHQLRRFFQDRGYWWTTTRKTTAWKWTLVIITGILIGLMGFFVLIFTHALTYFKFQQVDEMIAANNWAAAYFSYLFICLFFSLVAGCLCLIEPCAAGSGIPDIKAYLNGINLNKVVRIRVLFAKVVGMCFSCASGLPLGKEGPMIHAGSIIGAAVSQGKTITFGFDTSWTKFQDLRNDRSKRDFVTFGAAAGVAAAFSAPIGGILFTLEEGASFWSTTLTFRAFFCAMITQLIFSSLSSTFDQTSTELLTFSALNNQNAGGVFAFGSFSANTYTTYELLFFILMGAAGGVMGAFFNRINKEATLLRRKHLTSNFKKIAELLALTFVFSTISFVLPLVYDNCIPVPTDTAGWTSYQQVLLVDLQQFRCPDYQYNQLASLYMIDSDVAMQQLFHFQEGNGSTYQTFTTGALVLFFVPYFLMAAITSGTFCPAGLFVPTLLSGAAYGRMIGHILNVAAPGQVSQSGTYALIGAAAVLGGMSRMTIAGTVIVLEAAGSPNLLLPLMLTFAAARYSGNAINSPMYDMHIEIKELPFLEGQLKTLGLLNYHPVTEIMAHPVVSVEEINRVGLVYEILSKTKHNGFPVVSKSGHLRGLILRKHLCSLLKFKAFSLPGGNPGGKTAAAVFHDTLERTYPRYPKIDEIDLQPDELNCWVDLRAYMDTAVYSINESSSIQKCYRFFRTMGLRHLVVVDGDHKVTGMITRHDITEHRLEHHWFREGENLQRFINVSPIEASSMESTVGLLNSDNDNNSDHGRGGGGGERFSGISQSSSSSHSKPAPVSSHQTQATRDTSLLLSISSIHPRSSMESSINNNSNSNSFNPLILSSSSAVPVAIASLSPASVPVTLPVPTQQPQRSRDRSNREPKSNKGLI